MSNFEVSDRLVNVDTAFTANKLKRKLHQMPVPSVNKPQTVPVDTQHPVSIQESADQ